jgi:hypothetical protein
MGAAWHEQNSANSFRRIRSLLDAGPVGGVGESLQRDLGRDAGATYCCFG